MTPSSAKVIALPESSSLQTTRSLTHPLLVLNEWSILLSYRLVSSRNSCRLMSQMSYDENEATTKAIHCTSNNMIEHGQQ